MLAASASNLTSSQVRGPASQTPSTQPLPGPSAEGNAAKPAGGGIPHAARLPLPPSGVPQHATSSQSADPEAEVVILKRAEDAYRSSLKAIHAADVG